mmetsp:Transcript_24270/g.43189  ORF Transcript_24270/g.43189 Transcript_24270/m.43189 type:complete len:450 (+) Transcript_24270:32-1381(+)
MLSSAHKSAIPWWLSTVCLILLSLSIAFMVSSLAVPYWVYQGSDFWSMKMNMSLYKCNNCPLFAGDWSWQCFARWFCEFNSAMDACIFFDEGHKANLTYIMLEILALVAGILLLEKLLAFILHRDYGSPTSLYAFGILMTVFHFLATILWFGLTEASFNTDCVDSENVQDGIVVMCASIGPALAIAGVVSSTVTVITFVAIFHRRTRDLLKLGVESGSLFRLSTKTWMTVVLVSLIICSILTCSSIYAGNWVKRDSDEITFHGGLLECADCDQEYLGLGWDCFSGFMCDIDSSLGYCIMYEDLKDAGRLYIALAVTSLVFILLWGQGVVFIIQGREYGFASLNYIYATLAVLFQALAVIVWFKTSKASFVADCGNPLMEITEVPQLCSTNGPGIAIASTCVLGVTAVLYIVAFFKRGTSYEKEISLKYVELREVEMAVETPKASGSSKE